MQDDSEHATPVAGLDAQPATSGLAARLRQAVAEAGTQKAVSERSGVKLGALKTYLRGRDMQTEALVKLAAATGVRLEWLAAGTGPMREAAPTAGVAEPRESAPPRALGLTWQADPDRLARAYQQALDGLVVLPGHRPDPRRLMQITLLIYDELTEAEQAAARADSEPPKSP